MESDTVLCKGSLRGPFDARLYGKTGITYHHDAAACQGGRQLPTGPTTNHTLSSYHTTPHSHKHIGGERGGGGSEIETPDNARVLGAFATPQTSAAHLLSLGAAQSRLRCPVQRFVRCCNVVSPTLQTCMPDWQFCRYLSFELSYQVLYLQLRLGTCHLSSFLLN